MRREGVREGSRCDDDADTCSRHGAGTRAGAGAVKRGNDDGGDERTGKRKKVVADGEWSYSS